MNTLATAKNPSADAVRLVVMAAVGGDGGRQDAWRVEGPVVTARQARIYRAWSPLAPWPLAIKAFTPEVPLKLIEQQADRLARCHKAMSDRPDLAVPALWAALPEHRMLLMEWIEEPRMDRLLWQAGWRRQRRVELLTAAGRWLRHLHETSGIAPQPLQSARLTASLGALAEGRDPVFRAAHDVLRRLAPQFAGVPVDHVETHGDFVPHNLFHGPRRTVGLDFKSRPWAPFAQDMFHFLIQAETEKPFPTRRDNMAEWGLERQDHEAFLSGYGPPARPADDRLMRFLLLVEVSRRWRKHIARRRLPVLSHVKAARLRRLASELLASLGGSAGPA